MTGTLAAISAALRTIHQPTGTIQCGARANSKIDHGSLHTRIKEVRLFCTEKNGHEGGHRDQICCWSTHLFSDEIVESREPRDLRSCAGCGDKWPCATINVLVAEGV